MINNILEEAGKDPVLIKSNPHSPWLKAAIPLILEAIIQ